MKLAELNNDFIQPGGHLLHVTNIDLIDRNLSFILTAYYQLAIPFRYRTRLIHNNLVSSRPKWSMSPMAMPSAPSSASLIAVALPDAGTGTCHDEHFVLHFTAFQGSQSTQTSLYLLILSFVV